MKIYYLFVLSLLGAVAPICASQLQEEYELPLRELLEDASIVAVVEFVYELNGFELVELLQPRPNNSAQEKKILKNYFVEHKGRWIGAVSSSVNYREDLLSVSGPRLMLDVPYLVFLRRTKDPNNFNRSVLGSGLIIPTSACSYQFAQGEYGAVPIIDLSPASLSPEVVKAVEAMNKNQGWRTYSGDQFLERVARPKMLKAYGVYDGRIVFDAYKALFALIASSSESERVSTYLENINNPVFLYLLGELISNIDVEVEIGSNDLEEKDLTYTVGHSVINTREPEIYINDDLREYLNGFRIDELDLDNVQLSVVLDRVAKVFAKSKSNGDSKISFQIEPSLLNQTVTIHYKNLKLGDILFFLGSQYYINFIKIGDKIMVKRL